jgi:hypothetical protein
MRYEIKKVIISNIKLNYIKYYYINKDTVILIKIENDELYFYILNNKKIELLKKFNIIKNINIKNKIQISNNLKYIIIPNDNLICIYNLSNVNNNELKLEKYFKFDNNTKYFLTNESMITFNNDRILKLYKLNGEKKEINLANILENFSDLKYNLSGRGNYFYISDNKNFIQICTRDLTINDTILFGHTDCLTISDDGHLIITIIDNKLRIIKDSKIYDFNIDIDTQNKIIFIKNIEDIYTIYIYDNKIGNIGTYGFYNSKIYELEKIEFDNYLNNMKYIQTNGDNYMIIYEDTISLYNIYDINEYIMKIFGISNMVNILNNNNNNIEKKQINITNEYSENTLYIKYWIALLFNDIIKLKRFENYEEMIVFRDEYDREHYINIMTIIFDMINNFKIIEDIINKLPNINHFYLLLSIMSQLLKNLNNIKYAKNYLKNIIWINIYYMKKTKKILNKDKINSILKNL